jgi:alkylation response protein AidB-like acyl-CoA dehydrogenase
VVLRDSPSEQKFRRELRAWLADAVPAYGPRRPGLDWAGRREYDADWQRRLFAAGWAGIDWPAEYGGRGATLAEQLVYHEECARARAPEVGVNFVGMRHGGPTLMVEGTPEQKAAHLPAILRGEQIWCQGFSEPGAGSDLAALATRAERRGDEYLVYGHKIWSSYAQVADYAELLVRTDPGASKHGGISWLILRMDQPGIEVRPLRTLMGESEFSEVFLEGARVPVSQRVGNENDGWRITNVTLRFERGTAFAARMYELGERLRLIAALARRVTRGGAAAWSDRGLRRDLGRLVAEADGLWAMLKLAVSQARESGVPGIGASAIKLFFTELEQRVNELGVRLLGRAGLAREDLDGLPAARLNHLMLQCLSMTIAAGSSQVQRNIIAERILGLPKDR